MNLQIFIQPLKQLGSILFYILSHKKHYLNVNLPRTPQGSKKIPSAQSVHRCFILPEHFHYTKKQQILILLRHFKLVFPFLTPKLTCKNTENIPILQKKRVQENINKQDYLTVSALIKAGSQRCARLICRLCPCVATRSKELQLHIAWDKRCTLTSPVLNDTITHKDEGIKG